MLHHPACLKWTAALVCVTSNSDTNMQFLERRQTETDTAACCIDGFMCVQCVTYNLLFCRALQPPPWRVAPPSWRVTVLYDTSHFMDILWSECFDVHFLYCFALSCCSGKFLNWEAGELAACTKLSIGAVYQRPQNKAIRCFISLCNPTLAGAQHVHRF